MLNVIFEDNHLLVVEKPVNILSQGDNTNDDDMVNLLKKYLKEKYNKPGNVFVGLVHRLDRPVGGIMVFAKTSKAASRLSEQVRNKTFKKTYKAVINGDMKKREDNLSDYLYKDKKTNMVSVVNHPLYGDQRYGKNVNKKGQQIALWSYKIEIEHPTKKEKMEFICEPPNKYPWNMF